MWYSVLCASHIWQALHYRHCLQWPSALHQLSFSIQINTSRWRRFVGCSALSWTIGWLADATKIFTASAVFVQCVSVLWFNQKLQPSLQTFVTAPCHVLAFCWSFLSMGVRLRDLAWSVVSLRHSVPIHKQDKILSCSFVTEIHNVFRFNLFISRIDSRLPSCLIR